MLVHALNCETTTAGLFFTICVKVRNLILGFNLALGHP